RQKGTAMTQQRKKKKKRDTEQRRIRARSRTEQQREGHDDLDLPRAHLPPPGILPPGTDLGRPDDADADISTEPEEEEDAPAEDDPQEPSFTEQVRLTDLLGSRPPVVHLRLGERDGAVEVAVCSRPWSRATTEALEELRELLDYLFTARSAQF